MKKTTLLLFASLPLAALAQPTIGGGDAPAVGQQYIYHGDATYMTLPPGAAGQTWDFSTAGGTAGGTITVMSAGSAPGGSNFPDADVALTAPDFGEFIAVTSSGFEHHGQYLGTDNVIYSDKELYLQIPCTFGTTWTDDFAGSWNGGTYTFTGTTTSTASGYGDLVLPWGTLSNVLRVDVTQSRTENTGFSYTRTATYFFRPGTGYYVGFNDHLETFVSGSPLATNEEFSYIDASSVGMAETGLPTIGLDVFPVPASGTVNVVFGAQGAVHCRIYDAQGRVVHDEAMGTLSPGIHRHAVDVAALPAGLYTVRMNAADGSSGQRCFTVE